MTKPIGRKRAFALVTAMLLAAVLLIMIGGLTHRVRQAATFQLAGRQDIAALAAAESGLDDVLQRWSQTPAWEQPLDIQLPGSTASYRVRFAPDQSVNNLLGLEAKDGPAGPLSVPAGLAYVVVEGAASGRVHRIEALVGPQGLGGRYNSAILANRDILFQGDVAVAGRSDSPEGDEVDADVVSTSNDARNNIIRGDSGVAVNIQGAVRANSNQAGSIQSAIGSGASKGPKTGQSVALPARINVVEHIEQHQTDSPPVLTGLYTQLPAGDYYVDGDFQYSGDLDLGGANLYVKGNANVTGSVSGRGSLFVAGTTSLFGNADLEVGSQAAVALYSKGDVTLEGIGGNAYLREVAQQAQAAGRLAPSGLDFVDHLSDYQDWTPQLSAALTKGWEFPSTMSLSDSTALHDYAFGNRDWNKNAVLYGGNSFRSDFDAIAKLLSNTAASSGDYGFVQVSPGSNRKAPLLQLHRLLEDPAASDPFKNRLLKRRLNALIEDGNPKGGLLATHGGAQDVEDCQNDLVAAAASGRSKGLFDALNDAWGKDWTQFPQPILRQPGQKLSLLRQTEALAESLGDDELGTTRFRGLIYTEGNLTIRNDLRVEGAIYAIGPNSNIVLDRVKVTYVPELASRAGSSLGVMGVRLWYRR